MRNRMDFLRYCENDIYWWQTWFNQLALYCVGLLFRTNTTDSLGLSASQTLVILIAGAILNITLYFNKKFEFTKLDKVLLGTILIVTIMLIPRYVYVREHNFIWWGPIVLEIIVAHVLMFVQMAVEKLTFPK